MALVALHAVQAAAVDRDDGALHVNQIILAQVLSFPIKDCATTGTGLANSALHLLYRILYLPGHGGVITAIQ
jgi:hypothetical protein